MPTLIEKSLSSNKETKQIEFKSELNTDSPQHWCEIIKDIIAISNSGGGAIVVGVDDSGNPTDFNPAALLAYDPADITNKIEKYTGDHFSSFEVVESEKEGTSLAIFLIYGSKTPIVFRKPGTYTIEGNKQRTAFKEGSVYFRHGAKSSPGNTNDLRRAFEKELQRVQKTWLSDVRKIVTAPDDADLIVVPKSMQESASGKAAVVRLTTDPSAPAVGSIDYDRTHPYRQKELVERVKARLPEGVRFNSHDVVSIRYAHDIADHPEFQHKPKYGSPQYSEALVDWIVDSYKKDSGFLKKAREKAYEIRNQ